MSMTPRNNFLNFEYTKILQNIQGKTNDLNEHVVGGKLKISEPKSLEPVRSNFGKFGMFTFGFKRTRNDVFGISIWGFHTLNISNL